MINVVSGKSANVARRQNFEDQKGIQLMITFMLSVCKIWSAEWEITTVRDLTYLSFVSTLWAQTRLAIWHYRHLWWAADNAKITDSINELMITFLGLSLTL